MEKNEIANGLVVDKLEFAITAIEVVSAFLLDVGYASCFWNSLPLSHLV